MDYEDFIRSKGKSIENKGFDIALEDINKTLFDFQRDIVRWALKKGCCALFEGCGLGKTRQQLEWAKFICIHTNKPVLIVAPLGVTKQTAYEEAPELGLKVNICRKQSDVKSEINITNYEMIEYFDGDSFGGVVLDESSILKNFTGKTKTLLKNIFKNTPYKLCCTATPAPNDYMELLNHADFLGIMSTAQSLSNFFINDMKTGDWRLKGHATDDFWKWCTEWSVNIASPSDLGYKDDRYNLPTLNEIEEIINIELIDDNFENGFFREVQTSATSFYKEKKRTAELRAKKCAEIVQRNSNDQFIVWCDTNNEADYLKEFISDSVEVRGEHKNEYKEQVTEKFKSGEIKVLISKPKIFGYGMNFQKCHKMIFCGLTYSYENYYQAVRRIYRFGQTHDVDVTVVLGSTEVHILEEVLKKQRRQEEMKNKMKMSLKDIQVLGFKGKQIERLATNQIHELPTWLN